MAELNVNLRRRWATATAPTSLKALEIQKISGKAIVDIPVVEPKAEEESRPNASRDHVHFANMPMSVSRGMSAPFPPNYPKYQSRANPDIKFSHGTTTMGFMFKHGVCIAVDSRASMGSYIGSNSVKKVIEIRPNLLGTMAGGAADCQYWERNLARQVREKELADNRPVSVCAASKMLANVMYYFRGYGLSMGTMIAGYDKGVGPALYYVDSDGMRLKHHIFSVGSGSTYAYGVLDTDYRWDLTPDEAVEVGRRAICHATHRDAMSGGTIRVYLVLEDGWVMKYIGDMNDLIDQYREAPAVEM